MDAAKLMAVFSVALAIISTSIFSTVSSQEVEDEREFSYVVGDDHGPERWSLIHREWELCNNGLLQSPIDISDKNVEVDCNLTRLRRTYRTSPATLINRGHDVMLQWEGDGAGGFWLNGTEYTLYQLHWHSPSEHTLNGKRFPAELHMVHMSADNKTAVVGIIYRFGKPDPFLAEMEKYIKHIHGEEHSKYSAGEVNPRHIKLGNRKYYRYIGSLTTPPCTEGVVWTIMDKIASISKQQVKMLREAVMDNVDENARPTQDSNGRVVNKYRPAY